MKTTFLLLAVVCICTIVDAKLVKPKSSNEIPDTWFSPQYTTPAVAASQPTPAELPKVARIKPTIETNNPVKVVQMRFRALNNPPAAGNAAAAGNHPAAAGNQAAHGGPQPARHQGPASGAVNSMGPYAGSATSPPLVTSPAMTPGPMYELPYSTYNINSLPQEVPPPTSNPAVAHYSDGSSYPVDMSHFDNFKPF